MALAEIPQVLTIAGIDSSGGAGVNADTRLFALEHVYAATVITGVTAQNTYGVQALAPTEKDLLVAQLEAVFSDLDIKAMKTGALFDAQVVQTLVDYLPKVSEIPLVIDPVMVAKGGAKLLSDEAIQLLTHKLLPFAYLVTPNTAEAEVMTGIRIDDEADMLRAAEMIQALGVKNVLIKGGHMTGDTVADLLYTEAGQIYWYTNPRFETIRTHGTGDTLSAFITAHLAKGQELPDILAQATDYMSVVIQQGINVGHGHGPLNLWAEKE